MRGFCRKPVPFVVLASARSGTNHFISLIRQHPSVQAFYELLHETPEERARWKAQRYDHTTEPVAAFLDRVYWHSYHPLTRAVGFKLFFTQALDEPLVDAWRYLAEIDSLKVIELVRRNRFHQFVSLEVARQTWVWDERVDLPEAQRPEYPKLSISAEGFREYLRESAEIRARALAALGREPAFVLAYEDLCAAQGATLAQVFSYLGVWRYPFAYLAKEELRKQRRIPIHEQVLNYEALKAEFSGSAEEIYFL